MTSRCGVEQLSSWGEDPELNPFHKTPLFSLSGGTVIGGTPMSGLTTNDEQICDTLGRGRVTVDAWWGEPSLNLFHKYLGFWPTKPELVRLGVGPVQCFLHPLLVTTGTFSPIGYTTLGSMYESLRPFSDLPRPPYMTSPVLINVPLI